ncbi:MAG: hypothetical protein ABEJ66_03315, partial [Candidatus Nanohaloarchaea archaeon]
MVKPAKMSKVSVTGPRSELQAFIEELHDLALMDIEEYEGELEAGEPFENAEELSQTLVDVRSLISKMPDVDAGEEQVELDSVQQHIQDISGRIGELEDRKSEAESEISDLEDQEEFFHRLQGAGIEAEDLEGLETLAVYVGRFDTGEFREETSASHEIYSGEDLNVVFYRERDSEEIESALREINAEEVTPVSTEFRGSPGEVLEGIQDRKEELRSEKEEAEQEMEEVAEEWKGKLEAAEKFLTEKVEKSEAPMKFATTERMFIAEGWVPSEELDEL